MSAFAMVKETIPGSALERIIHRLGDELFKRLNAGEIEDIPDWFWSLVALKSKAEIRELAAQEREGDS